MSKNISNIAAGYHYTTVLSRKDGWISTVAEMPLLSWIDDDRGKSERGIRHLVMECLLDMSANGEQIPEPGGNL